MTVAVACALALVLVGGLASPQPAVALPSPADLLPGINVPGLDPSQWVVGFKAILQFIFGDQLDELGSHLVNLLLSVPLLTDSSAFPRLNDYRAYVTGGAWGLLALSFVIASMRYWLSSYSGSAPPKPATPWSRRAGAQSASPARCAPSTSASAPAADTRSPSLRARENSPRCSGVCSNAARTMPTSSRR